MTNFGKIASMTSALALAMSMGTVSAQTTGGDASASGAQGGGNTASSMSFQNWLNARSGKITRQAYMEEVGRRWDMMDRERVGLTSDEINRLYWTSAVGMGGPTSTSAQDKKGIKQ
jgi:hypothetical protein